MASWKEVKEGHPIIVIVVAAAAAVGVTYAVLNVVVISPRDEKIKDRDKTIADQKAAIEELSKTVPAPKKDSSVAVPDPPAMGRPKEKGESGKAESGIDLDRLVASVATEVFEDLSSRLEEMKQKGNASVVVKGQMEKYIDATVKRVKTNIEDETYLVRYGTLNKKVTPEEKSAVARYLTLSTVDRIASILSTVEQRVSAELLLSDGWTTLTPALLSNEAKYWRGKLSALTSK